MTDANANAAVAAWARALRRCVASRSHAVVDGSVVLLFADAPRVLHPAQALVYDTTTPTDGHGDDDDDEDSQLQGRTVPLVVAMRLHPKVSALLEALTEANVAPESVDAVVASLVFRDHVTPVANSSTHEATLQANAPVFATRSVNVDGGALVLYGENQQSASQALALATRAITGSAERLGTGLRRLIFVVEHREGYLARDFVVSSASTEADDNQVELPRLITIQKRDWDSGAIAQSSLDDALEAYEAAFNEEQEINGNAEAAADPRSLEISVKAAFEVREKARGAHSSAFLMDADEAGGFSKGVPPVVLFSQWEGLENVRSLACKPPSQSTSTLCFSGEKESGSSARLPSPRLSFALLTHLDRAIRDASSHTWKSLPVDMTAIEVIQDFKKFLRNMDQDSSDDAARDADDTTNNTIASTVSLALDGERQRSDNAAVRADMDPIEKLWDFLVRHADGTELTKQLLQEFIVFLSNTRVFPAPHPDNDTALAKLVRLRQDESQGTATTESFTAAAQQMLAQPLDACASLIEAGEWKMKRDVTYSLAQAGFSSQECTEFVHAMPRFDVHTRISTHAQWKAMDHVLQLCTTGLAVHLPVSFMRKVVHDCVAYHAHNVGAGTAAGPSILVDLQSFIPDRLRASIADPLFWNLRIAFNEDFEHRLLICQDSFHSTAPNPNQSQDLLDELVLDDTTLRVLQCNTPEAVLVQTEMNRFITKLEDCREKRMFEQLHDIDIPTGMTRYDCTVRRLFMFP